MVDYLEIGKGCLFLIGAFLYLRYFNKILKGDSIIDKLVNFKASIGVLILLICGLVIIYKEIARYFNWDSL